MLNVTAYATCTSLQQAIDIWLAQSWEWELMLEEELF